MFTFREIDPKDTARYEKRLWHIFWEAGDFRRKKARVGPIENRNVYENRGEYRILES